jgi:hypothetical protein
MKLNKIALTILIVTTCVTSLTPAYSCPDGLSYSDRFNMMKNLSTTGQKADKDIEKNSIPRSPEQDTATMLQLVSKSTHQPIANQSIVIISKGTIYCGMAPCPQPVKEWTGRTNSEGLLSIPSQAMQLSILSQTIATTKEVTVAGFQSKILPEYLHKQAGVTKIELSTIDQ